MMAVPKKLEKKYYLGNKNLPTGNSSFEYSKQMIKDIDKCRKNILYFAENFFYIVNLDEGQQKIKLHKYQKDLLRKLRDNRFVCTLASRQIGKTTILTIFALWQACFNDHQKILIVANKEGTAIEIFKRVRMAYEELPNWIKPGVGEGYGKTSMELDNGSSIGISTTTGTAARGQSCNVLILDEIAFIDQHLVESFWSSVFPIISSSKKSKVFMASTPNGTGNLFHEKYHGAVSGKNNWTPFRVDWWQVPGRDEKWKDEMISALGSQDIFDQEYGNKFVEVGASDIEDVYEELKAKCVDPLDTFDNGNYRVWDTPKPDHIYVAGVDTGEGVGKDSSTIQILDITNLAHIVQVAEFSDNKINPTIYAKKVYEILKHWGSPPALVERNSCGSAIVGALHFEYNYPKLVTYNAAEIAIQKKASKGSVQPGVQSHTNTKYKAVINYKYWLKELKAVQINSSRTIEEMKNFIRYPNGSWSARSGYHDDLIMALIWGLMILEPMICEKWFEIVEWDDRKKPRIIKQDDHGLADFLPFNKKSQDNLINAPSPMIFDVFNFGGVDNGTIMEQPNGRTMDMFDLVADGWEQL
tara:strand:+ start:777 stop:2525 length:1749 start_codon:yes stop_codon:yes gene_type:complete